MLLKPFLILLAAGSIVAFLMYGIDKWKAKRGAWRISEKALLLCGFLCGSVGALAAMQLFRHKTKHYYFYAVNILGLAWQIVVAYLLYAKGF